MGARSNEAEGQARRAVYACSDRLRANHGRSIEKDPDERVRGAIEVVFAKFAEFGSARRVFFWLGEQGMEVPSVASADSSERVVWKAPRYHSLLSLLQNPTHAGVYAYGRSKTLVRIESGRKRVVHTRNRDAKDWAMMLPEHQDGYIGWDAYRGNQELMGCGQNQGVIRLQNYPTILALLQ